MTDRGVPIGGTGFKAYTLEYQVDLGTGAVPVQVEPIVLQDATDPTKRMAVKIVAPVAGDAGAVVRDVSGENRNNLAGTLLNLLPALTTQRVLRLKGHGANGQFDYHLRNDTGAAVDAATWEVLRFRKVGPSSAAAATYVRSGATVTVTLTSAHNLETGDLAYHTGATDTGLNGYAKITVVDSTHYTFTTASVGTATGSITLNPNGPEVKYRTGVNPTTTLETGW